MSAILLIGLDVDDIQKARLSGRQLIQHSTGFPLGMTAEEYLKKCHSLVKKSEVVLVKFRDDGHVNPDEIILIHTAYMLGIPIFGCGQSGIETMVQCMATNWFFDVEDAGEHIKVYY